jgi:hypothetical protein
LTLAAVAVAGSLALLTAVIVSLSIRPESKLFGRRAPCRVSPRDDVRGAWHTRRLRVKFKQVIEMTMTARGQPGRLTLPGGLWCC